MVAKRERMARNVLSAVPWAWDHVIASNGRWRLTADQHWRDVNFAWITFSHIKSKGGAGGRMCPRPRVAPLLLPSAIVNQASVGVRVVLVRCDDPACAWLCSRSSACDGFQSLTRLLELIHGSCAANAAALETLLPSWGKRAHPTLDEGQDDPAAENALRCDHGQLLSNPLLSSRSFVLLCYRATPPPPPPRFPLALRSCCSFVLSCYRATTIPHPPPTPIRGPSLPRFPRPSPSLPLERSFLVKFVFFFPQAEEGQGKAAETFSRICVQTESFYGTSLEERPQ